MLTSKVETLVRSLQSVPNVKGIVLGGSRARGPVETGADWDIGLYYDAGPPPAFPVVLGTIEPVVDEPPVLTSFGERGPWINGGGWLRVGGKLDLLYRDIEWVSRWIAAAREGNFTSSYQAGHPAGFHSFMLMAEVHHNIILWEAGGSLSLLRLQTVPCPPALREAVISKFYWDAQFHLQIAQSQLERTSEYFF